MKLTDSNFLLYGMHHYDKVSVVSVQEFENDIDRFKYLKKLLTRYQDKGDLNERLILNHLIILYNMFGNATTDMLFFKIDKKQWNILSTFLIYLSRMPVSIPTIGLYEVEIEVDEFIESKLKEL